MKIFLVKINAKIFRINKISKFQIKTRSILLIFLFVSGSRTAQHVTVTDPKKKKENYIYSQAV